MTVVRFSTALLNSSKLIKKDDKLKPEKLFSVTRQLLRAVFSRNFIKIYHDVIAPVCNNAFYNLFNDLISLLLPFEADKFAEMSTVDIIKYYGYPVEEHKVLTQDGYILTLFRIPFGRDSPLTENSKPKQPILLLHGLFCSSSIWVLRGFEDALGFILADRGFDVWLGNVRGTRYSNTHVNLSPMSANYWNYSLTELGIYDLSSTIDYIILKTKFEKIIHLGHSLGNAVCLVLCSLKPEYNQKIHALISLAPTAYIGNLKSKFVNTFLNLTPGKIETFAKITGWHDFFRSSKILPKISKAFCKKGQFFEPLFKGFLFEVCGQNENDYCNNSTIMATGHFPESTSLKNLLHLAQMKITNTFANYDYESKDENKRIYGVEKAPAFDLSKVSVPVHMIWGKNDKLLQEENIQRLRKELPNVISCTPVSEANWSHYDFMFGKNAAKNVYNLVIDISQSYITTNKQNNEI